MSLEFITDVADGLLLYSGPLAQLQAWDHEDFMAIGMMQRHFGSIKRGNAFNLFICITLQWKVAAL